VGGVVGGGGGGGGGVGGKPCKTVRLFVVEAEDREWNCRPLTVSNLHISFGELHTLIYLHHVTVYRYKSENRITRFVKFYTGHFLVKYFDKVQCYLKKKEGKKKDIL